MCLVAFYICNTQFIMSQIECFSHSNKVPVLYRKQPFPIYLSYYRLPETLLT